MLPEVPICLAYWLQKAQEHGCVNLINMELYDGSKYFIPRFKITVQFKEQKFNHNLQIILISFDVLSEWQYTKKCILCELPNEKSIVLTKVYEPIINLHLNTVYYTNTQHLYKFKVQQICTDSSSSFLRTIWRLQYSWHSLFHLLHCILMS